MWARPLPGKLALFAVPLIFTLAHVTTARGADDDAPREDVAPEVSAPENATSENPVRENAPREPASLAADAGPRHGGAGYYPPSVDGPALRLPESLTHVSVDAAYAISNDL